VDSVLELIKLARIDSQLEELLNISDVSDGQHTFGELYEQVANLWVSLTKFASEVKTSRYDGAMGRTVEDYPYRSSIYKYKTSAQIFYLGLAVNGKTIEYEIPQKLWAQVTWATEQKPEGKSSFSENVQGLTDIRQ
jgi:hypothetical protein